MKYYGKFREAKIADISPSGWLKAFLEEEMSGITGNLHRIGYPFDRACWRTREATPGGYDAWWPYEQSAYWIDSVVRCAGMLKDCSFLDSVWEQIDAALQEDGDAFIGPLALKANNSCNRWPHAVYFRALYALWSWTGEEKYLERMLKHYRADSGFDYSRGRDTVNIETMLRLADHYGDDELAKRAAAVYEAFDSRYDFISTAHRMMGDDIPNEHGVTYNEQAKLPAILYLYTGERAYLDAAVHGYEKLVRYHMLPDGVHSSSEAPCGKETLRTHESCNISDFTWSLGYLLEATGNAKYADWIEWACFNACMGAIGPGYRSMQYLSCVNQPIAAHHSTHVPAWHNTPRMAYQPHHYPECCVANLGRAMPNYCLRMYQETEKGVAISLYGDSAYAGKAMEISQTGNYPFGDLLELKIHLKDRSKNELMLRVPGWAKQAVIQVNGQRSGLDLINGYMTVRVEDGDEITLRFEKGFSSHASADGGVYFTYGPFLMTLKIQEDRRIDAQERRSTEEFPAYDLYPGSEWNYAVTGWEKPVLVKSEKMEASFREPSFEIRIKARKLNGWSLIEKENPVKMKEAGEGLDQKQLECGATLMTDRLLLTPDLPDSSYIAEHLGEECEISLIPYGCTNVRLTVFPKIQRI